MITVFIFDFIFSIITIDVKRDKSWTVLDKRSEEIKKPGKERTIYA